MLKRLYTSCPARQRERLSLFHSEDPMEIGSVMRAFLDQVTLQPATKSVRGSFGRRLTGGESAPIIAFTNNHYEEGKPSGLSLPTVVDVPRERLHRRSPTFLCRDP